jgi:predicted double-glycine peptidase
MMRVWQGLGCALVLHLLAFGVAPAGEGAVSARSDPSSAVITRHSLKELRDRHVVKQQLDYTCGAAALATLLTYYFGEETSEPEVLQILTSGLTKDEQRLKAQRGFSLLDLKHVAQAKGYQAAGFKLTIEQLKQLAAPVIVFVQPLGYKHFAVLRGIDRGRVFLADPARGNLRMSIGRFLGEWDGIIFVLGKPGEEDISTYPLALPRPDVIQPELLGVSRLLDLGAFTTSLAVRSQPH